MSKKEKILETQRQNQHHKVKREKPKISDDRLAPVMPRLALNRTQHFWRMNQPEEKKITTTQLQLERGTSGPYVGLQLFSHVLVSSSVYPVALAFAINGSRRAKT